MSDHRDDLVRLLSGRSGVVKQTIERLDTLLVGNGCKPYVKTIYVGYELDGSMVAAAYPRGGWTEVALALPDDFDPGRLVDATHLTWPTLPVAMEVRRSPDIKACCAFASEALERVRHGQHDVSRPPEFFQSRVRRRGLGL